MIETVYERAVVELVPMMILGVVSLIIFGLSLAKSKKYMEATTAQNFRSAKNLNTASIIFFILNCIIFVQTVVTAIAFFAVLFSYINNYIEYMYFNMGTMEILMLIEGVISIAAWILGLISLVKFDKANRLYKSLNPPPPMPYNPYYNGGYPNQNRYYGNTGYSQQPPYPQPQRPYQQQPQQPGQQQPYQQGMPYQQPYSQQKNSAPTIIPPAVSPVTDSGTREENGAEINSAAPPIKQENNTYGIFKEENKEKRCPNCGVTNSEKNKFCTFCGKEL